MSTVYGCAIHQMDIKMGIWEAVRPIHLRFITWNTGSPQSLCHSTWGGEEGTCPAILCKELYMELLYVLPR